MLNFVLYLSDLWPGETFAVSWNKIDDVKVAGLQESSIREDCPQTPATNQFPDVYGHSGKHSFLRWAAAIKFKVLKFASFCVLLQKKKRAIRLIRFANHYILFFFFLFVCFFSVPKFCNWVSKQNRITKFTEYSDVNEHPSKCLMNCWCNWN